MWWIMSLVLMTNRAWLVCVMIISMIIWTRFMMFVLLGMFFGRTIRVVVVCFGVPNKITAARKSG